MEKEKLGLLLGLVGVICFSLTLPATSISVEYFGTTVVGLGRTVLAAIIAGIVLVVGKERVPNRQQFKSIVIVAMGAVLGFPLLTSWAMQALPVSHGAVEVALLPLATAGIAMLRAGEKPSVRFWIASLIGAGAVIFYAVNLGFGKLQFADLALLTAVIILGFSYAEGGKLSKEIGSWQVIAWAIVIGTPFFVIPVVMDFSVEMLTAPFQAWVSLFYLAIVSQFLAYIVWYGGMALGGVARVSQLQYIQPFIMIIFATIFLDESITLVTIVTAIIVVVSVIVGKNAPISKKTSPSDRIKNIDLR